MRNVGVLRGKIPVPMSRKVAVTGGAGFIGSNLAAALVERGDTVEVIDTLIAGKRELVPTGATLHEVDVRDLSGMTAVLSGADVVFHLAALPRVQDSIDDPRRTHDVNVNGTLTVLEAARASGVRRVVFASSAAVYGDQECVPLHEELPALPKSPYGLHKRLSEEMCVLWAHLYQVETVSFRFFNVYGPHFDPYGPYALVVGKFLSCALAGKPLPIVGDGTHTRDYIHVHDIVRGLLLGADKAPKTGVVINLGSGVETSVNTLARIIGGECSHLDPRIEPARSCASIERAWTLLGWKPTVELETGLLDLRAALVA